MVVFSLRRWSSHIPSGFLVSRRTLDTHCINSISPTGLLPCFVHLSRYVRLLILCVTWVRYPARIATCGLGSSDFARHYFRNRCYFLFLRVLRCFSSPGSPRIPMCSVYVNATLLALSSLIRISADQGSFAAPRSFSQLVTSFFGAMYQGIHLYALCSLIFLDCFFAIRRIFLPQRILILRFSANFRSVKLAGYFLRFPYSY